MVNLEALELGWRCVIAGRQLFNHHEQEEALQLLENAGYPEGWDARGIALHVLEEEDSETTESLLPLIFNTQQQLMEALSKVFVETNLKERINEKHAMMNNLFVDHYLKNELNLCDESVDSLLGVTDFIDQLDTAVHSKALRQQLKAARQRNNQHKRLIEDMKKEEGALDEIIQRLEKQMEHLLDPEVSSANLN